MATSQNPPPFLESWHVIDPKIGGRLTIVLGTPGTSTTRLGMIWQAVKSNPLEFFRRVMRGRRGWDIVPTVGQWTVSYDIPPVERSLVTQYEPLSFTKEKLNEMANRQRFLSQFRNCSSRDKLHGTDEEVSMESVE